MVGQTSERIRSGVLARATSESSVGYTAGIIVTPAMRQLRLRHPDADARTLHLACDDPRGALLDHRADAVVTRLPLTADGLRLTAVYDEPRVLVIPVDHRLAGKESVTLGDIAGEPLPEIPRTDPDKFEHIAEGDIVIVSAGLGPDGGRPDLTTVPLEDVEPSHVVLATRGRAQPARGGLPRVRPGLPHGNPRVEPVTAAIRRAG